MTKRLSLLPIVICTVLAAVAPSRADDSVRAFLKIDGIKGQSTNAKHIDEIDVAAFKLGVLQSLSDSTAGGGAGVGKPTFAPVTIFKGLDTASPLLFLACATGQHKPQAVLTLSERGRDTFVIRLSDVIVTSCDQNSNDTGNSELPLETIALKYSKIEITFTPATAKGAPGTPVTITFDVAGNRVP